MQSPGSRLYFPLALLVLACGAAQSGVEVFGATPTFTITASNVTMPSGGNIGSSPFNLTSVNGYVGQVRVDCAYSGGAIGAKVPSCGIFVNPVSTLVANKTATGSLTLVPYGKTIGFGSARLGNGGWKWRAPVLAAALAGFFLAGVLRRRARFWLWLLLAGVSLAGVTSCGSSMSGTFPYTATAVDIKTNATGSASFTVTVP
jgi:hypothetical protein